MNSVDFLLWLQAHRTPVWNAFFFLCSALGDTVGYLAVLPILYWTVDRRFLIRILVLALISGCLNSELKLLFHLPRPHDLVPEIVAVAHRSETGNGFPSGHSQTAACIWFYVMWRFRRPWLTALGVLVIVLVGFSRMYMGVHWPVDVIGGFAFGLILAGLFIGSEAWIDIPGNRSFKIICLAGVTSAVFIAGSIALDTTVGLAGAGGLLGLILGWNVGGDRIRQTSSLSSIGKLLSAVVGAVVAFVLYFLARQFRHVAAVQLVESFLLGLWIIWTVPAMISSLPIGRSHDADSQKGEADESTSSRALSPPMGGRG